MDKHILCDHRIAIISLSYLSSTTLKLHTTGFVTKVILECNGPTIMFFFLFFFKNTKKYTEKTT